MTEPADLSMRDRVALIRLPATADSPNTGRVAWLPWALCILLSFACLSMALRPGIAAPNSARAKDAPPIASSVITPGASSAAAGSTVLESKGYIIAAHQVLVSPIEVSGRILELFIEEGKRVKQGDKLAVLDEASFKAEHMEAEANLLAARARHTELVNGSRPEEIAQASAELKEAEESLKLAKLKYERNKSLGNTVSADEFEASQFAYTALGQRVAKLAKALELARLGPRQERIAAAEAEVQLAEARARRTKWRLDNCTIRAPISGTILKKTAEIGNLVSPLSFNVAASVCEMADLSDLEVDLEIPERDIAKIQADMPCVVTTDAYPNRPYRGFVSRLMPIALQNKAAIQVRVKVRVPADEEGVYLKPGMNARVTFLEPGPAP